MSIMLAVNIEGDVGPGCNLLKWAMPMAPLGIVSADWASERAPVAQLRP